MRTRLKLRTYNQKGESVLRYDDWAHSWTKHLCDIFYILFEPVAADLVNINDITGAARTIKAAALSNSMIGNLQVKSCCGGQLEAVVGNNVTDDETFNYLSPLLGELQGIVVGTDNTAVTPQDDAMGAIINHGEAAGEFLYGGTEIYGLTIAGANGSFVIRRYFTNVSGGGITVEEVGIYSPACTSGGTVPRYTNQFCIARDVTGGVAVADTEILEVTYTVQITV